AGLRHGGSFRPAPCHPRSQSARQNPGAQVESSLSGKHLPSGRKIDREAPPFFEAETESATFRNILVKASLPRDGQERRKSLFRRGGPANDGFIWRVMVDRTWLAGKLDTRDCTHHQHGQWQNGRPRRFP